MKGDFQLPIDVKYKTVPMRYGVEARVITYGRLCFVTINSQLTQTVNSWISYGVLPHAREQVITPNCAGMDCYLVLNYDGNLLCQKQLLAGNWLQATFVYILADDEY